MVLPAAGSLIGPQDLLLLRPNGLAGGATLRELAAALAERLPDVKPTDVLGAAALQASFLALAGHFDVQEPRALDRARAQAPEQLPSTLSGAGVGAGATAASELAALLVLRALAANPALRGLRPLLDLAPWPAVEAGVASAAQWLTENEPPLRGWGPLPAVFAQPAAAADTVEGQLEWMADAWSELLPPALVQSIGRVRGAVAEEQTHRGSGPGPVQGPGVGSGPGDAVGDDAEESFSEDHDWMPSCVLIAKQAFVWLDQLSKQHGQSITRLDQIPNEELDELAARGFTGLWLIGLWERSDASREIKRRMGNPEAEASAYSLWDYVIAERLGGEDAWRDLKERASERGIRLASDMVPNHVGIDGRWVVEHPDWFVQLPQPPYPGYTFDGPDLCEDSRVGVYLEDGYWTRSDAAVVFKRVDHHTGEVRYLYHGNDGTQMPWNDTAQLDYLNPAVREAVIQLILSVARRFPIIRFDAAMTLARRHVQRLWHPTPGAAGAVPSRAEHGADASEFAAAMPQEFWREVVERVQEETPGTLLLAEAFWMMEGYFVRNLGMHRVYNSAFMHMLRDEDNAKFRGMLREVLQTSPAVLERFVNFANNPDEDSAADQFGKDRKYFGVATLMATLPGLPMFGHGQVEGYTEKYGMEYSRAYRDETPDQGFIDHHERVIFPLLRRRASFCKADHFALLDLVREGGVDENVIAYSNRGGHGRSLVLFNNQWDSTSGWVAPNHLADALRLDSAQWYGMRELHSGLWFLRSGEQLATAGLFAALDRYETQVFADWRDLQDPDGRWQGLATALDGRGVEDLDVALARHERALTSDSEPDLHRALEEEVDGVGAELAGGVVVESVAPTHEDGRSGGGLEGEESREVDALVD